MPQELTLSALHMAITNRRPIPGLLHHSDRGSQYAAHEYRRVLDQHGMSCSMSRKGDCWDNAPMESFFGSLKTPLSNRLHHADQQGTTRRGRVGRNSCPLKWGMVIHRMTALEGHKPGPERPAGVQYYPELPVQPAPVAHR